MNSTQQVWLIAIVIALGLRLVGGKCVVCVG